MSFDPGHWKYRRPVLAMVIGAVIGYGYYALVGCHSGHCPITSNPFIATGFGAVIAGLATWPEGGDSSRGERRPDADGPPEDHEAVEGGEVR